MAEEPASIMETAAVDRAIEWQAHHAESNGASATGRVVRAMIPLLESDTQVGERMRTWTGLTLEDAMPLRLTGGFHNLHLTGAEDRLGPVYAGEVTDQMEVDAIVLAVTREHDKQLLPWFDGPPQTNEAGRSAGIMAGLLWLAQRLEPRFELNEIGASAGINTMMERFAFDLGGVRAGPSGSPLRIVPEWPGPPPPRSDLEIVSIQGCDLAPLDLADRDEALRLKSYVWPDMPARLARIDAAIALANERPPRLVKADAAEWVRTRLAAPQEAGVTRTLFHSIVWQYLPESDRRTIEEAMRAAGRRATPELPLAWVEVETNRESFRHEIRARFWPGGEEWALLGEAHPHGAWIEWFGR